MSIKIKKGIFLVAAGVFFWSLRHTTMTNENKFPQQARMVGSN
jgi:hypothetical protein